jgi:hypothetical protein
MSLTCQDLYKISQYKAYRLPGSVKLDLNYNIIGGFVQHYPDPPNGSWSKSDVPAGISVFASLVRIPVRRFSILENHTPYSLGAFLVRSEWFTAMF